MLLALQVHKEGETLQASKIEHIAVASQMSSRCWRTRISSVRKLSLIDAGLTFARENIKSQVLAMLLYVCSLVHNYLALGDNRKQQRNVMCTCM